MNQFSSPDLFAWAETEDNKYSPSKETLAAEPVVRRPAPSPSPQTVRQLRERVSSDSTLSDRKRQDLLSSLRRFVELTGLRESQYLTAVTARPFLKSPPLKVARLKRKTWSNIRSSIQFILDRYTKTSFNSLPKSVAWEKLLARIEKLSWRYGLSRFASWCSDNAIDPEGVSKDHLMEFGDWLEETRLVKDPRSVMRATVNAWNQTNRLYANGAYSELDKLCKDTGYTIPWKDLPHTLRDDADAWLNRLATGGDDFDDDGPSRPLRTATIESRRFTIQQSASILITNGQSIGLLKDLVVPERVAEVVTFFRERSGKETSSQISSVTATLNPIAKYWVRSSEADLKRLKTLTSKTQHKQSGLTEKNKKRLAQFKDPENIVTLVMLPGDTMLPLEQQKAPLSLSQARTYRNALAVDILLHMPIRLRNLATLNIERHFRFFGERTHVQIPADEVKNDKAIDVPLGVELTKRLRFYIEHVRPCFLVGEDAGWLWPGEEPGRPINKTVLGRAVSGCVKNRTGLDVNVHLFRHIDAYIFLEAYPTAFEAVSRLLSHKSPQTARNSYIGFEEARIFELFDRTLDHHRRTITGDG